MSTEEGSSDSILGAGRVVRIGHHRNWVWKVIGDIMASALLSGCEPLRVMSLGLVNKIGIVPSHMGGLMMFEKVLYKL